MVMQEGMEQQRAEEDLKGLPLGYDPSGAMMERKEDIIQLLKSTDFLIDLKNKLLGLKYVEVEEKDKETGERKIVGKYVPISPREIKEDSAERRDYETIDKDGKKHYYTNDAALMNQVGANEIISNVSLLLNPIGHLGSKSETLMLRQQRTTLFELSSAVILNKKRWGINENNLYLIDTMLSQFIMPILTLSYTDKPMSILEGLTHLYSEHKINRETTGDDSGRKRKFWSPWG